MSGPTGEGRILHGFGALLKWAGAEGTGSPERCSGLVWGVPSERGGGGRWGTQSDALGWYTMSRWDTGGGS
jgi:hypothetical protein